MASQEHAPCLTGTIELATETLQRVVHQPLERTVTLADHGQPESRSRAVRRPSAARSLRQLTIAETGGAAAATADLRIIELLGSGGMGVVHLAAEPVLNRQVAVKRLRDTAQPAEDGASLLHEARVTGSLEHPNVVPVHSLGQDEAGLPVIVMKRVSGVSWAELIRDPDHPCWPETPADPLRWHLETLLQVCNAVSFAHSRGLIHRDIKPSNVMIGGYGEVYLMDWGLAYKLGDSQEADYLVVGTPRYLAPEMLSGTGPEITPRTDVYLLGATLHEVLTGSYRHQGRTLEETLRSCDRSEPVDYGPEVPAELGRLCNQATHRDPNERPCHVLELRQQVAAFLEHRASLEVTVAAEQSLAELRRLRGAPTGETVTAGLQTSFAECAFGFRQALRSWPENSRAHDGLEQACLLMFAVERERRNISAAAAVLAHLPSPRPDLEAQLSELQDLLAEETLEIARLRRVARDNDPRVASRSRAAVSVIFGLVSLAAAWGLELRYPAARGLSNDVIAAFMTVMALGAALTAYAKRRTLATTKVNRMVWATSIGTLAAGAINHFIAARLGAPVAFALAVQLMLCTVPALLLAVALHRSAAWIVVPLLGGALLTAAVPNGALIWVGVAFLFTFGLTGWLWLKIPGPESPPPG